MKKIIVLGCGLVGRVIAEDLSTKFIVEFLKNIKDQKIPSVIKNQREIGLDFHFLDLETIKEVSKN